MSKTLKSSFTNKRRIHTLNTRGILIINGAIVVPFRKIPFTRIGNDRFFVFKADNRTKYYNNQNNRSSKLVKLPVNNEIKVDLIINNQYGKLLNDDFKKKYNIENGLTIVTEFNTEKDPSDGNKLILFNYVTYKNDKYININHIMININEFFDTVLNKKNKPLKQKGVSLYPNIIDNIKNDINNLKNDILYQTNKINETEKT